METLEPKSEAQPYQRPPYVEEHRVRMRIGAKGRLVIPASMRAALKIADGDTVDLKVVDGEIRIVSLREQLRRAQQRARRLIPAGVSLADELSAERREAAKHE